MKQRELQRNGITEGIIWKQLLAFFFPILFGAFFQQLYNTADAMVVGRFVGKEALAAVGGSTGTLINLLVGFFIGLSSGATVTISQYYGAGKQKEVSDAVHTAVALSIAGGFLLMIVGLIFAETALAMMNTPEDVIEHSAIYLRIYFIGMIPNLLYNMGAGILRAIGDSKRPLYFLMVSCLVNIILDILFVAVLGMGVAGVASATVLSQCVSMILVILCLLKTKESYRMEFKKIRFHVETLKMILLVGLPAGLQSVMYTVSNIIIQSSVNSFGTDTVAAWTAYGKVDALFWMIINAFGVSITTFVGQNFGASRIDRIQKSVRVCLAMAFGTTVLLSVALYTEGHYLYYLFSDDGNVIAIGTQMLRFLTPTYFTYICIEILSGALRATGHALIPMIMTCMGVCVLRIVWIVAAVPIWRDIRTVMMSYPITWVVTSILFLIYYRICSKRNFRRTR